VAIARATRKVTVAQAMTPPKSSLDQIIHLIPPRPRMASAAPPLPSGPILHQQATLAAPAKASVVALRAPASLPAAPSKQPTNSDGPASALAAVAPAREVSAPTPLSPPSQAAAGPPPAVALPVAAVATTEAARPVAIAPVAAVATASPAAPPATASSTPVALAAPLQMAAATTTASALSQLKFGVGATDLPAGNQPVLDSVVNRLLANDNLRVQVIAHATGGADDAMEARRVSLARAVAVRAYLIEKGVRSLRIDVRALGNRADGGPAADQVDLMIVSQ
jgi:outer membrane protein OmpA-like peptidoglycan-associated protein